MRNTVYKNAEMAWDKDSEAVLMINSIERLARKERHERDLRFVARKHLDKGYVQTSEAINKKKQAAKTPDITGPVSIEALGSTYPKQVQKMQANDMR